MKRLQLLYAVVMGGIFCAFFTGCVTITNQYPSTVATQNPQPTPVYVAASGVCSCGMPMNNTQYTTAMHACPVCGVPHSDAYGYMARPNSQQGSATELQGSSSQQSQVNNDIQVHDPQVVYVPATPPIILQQEERTDADRARDVVDVAIHAIDAWRDASRDNGGNASGGSSRNPGTTGGNREGGNIGGAIGGMGGSTGGSTSNGNTSSGNNAGGTTGGNISGNSNGGPGGRSTGSVEGNTSGGAVGGMGGHAGGGTSGGNSGNNGGTNEGPGGRATTPTASASSGNGGNIGTLAGRSSQPATLPASTNGSNGGNLSGRSTTPTTPASSDNGGNIGTLAGRSSQPATLPASTNGSNGGTITARPSSGESSSAPASSTQGGVRQPVEGASQSTPRGIPGVDGTQQTATRQTATVVQRNEQNKPAEEKEAPASAVVTPPTTKLSAPNKEEEVKAEKEKESGKVGSAPAETTKVLQPGTLSQPGSISPPTMVQPASGTTGTLLPKN